MGNISELHHVVNLPPAVLTDPAVAAAAVGVEGGADDIPAAVMRGTNPVILVLAIYPVLVPVVGGHHAGVSIGPAKHEGVGHLSVESASAGDYMTPPPQVNPPAKYLSSLPCLVPLHVTSRSISLVISLVSCIF